MVVPPVFVAGILLAFVSLWEFYLGFRAASTDLPGTPSALIGGPVGCWPVGWLIMNSLAAVRRWTGSRPWS